jgi:hypothetical protein
MPRSTPAVVSVTSSLPADAPALTGLTLVGRDPELFWIVRIVNRQPDGPVSTFLVFDDRTLGLVGVLPGS